MPAPIIFNDLSAEPPAAAMGELTARIHTLVNVARQAMSKGAERGIRVRQNFYSCSLSADGCTILRWLDQQPEDEMCLLIKDLIGTLQHIEESAIEDDFFLNGKNAIALGAAYSLGGLAISFNSPPWNRDQLQIERVWICNNGNINSECINVRHACNSPHIDSHAAWLKSRINLVEASEPTAKICIEEEILRQVPDFVLTRVNFRFSEDFLGRVKKNGFWTETGMKHVLAETCARVLLETPKNEVREWITTAVYPGWKAYRTHLTKSGPGYRLMLWVTPEKTVVFANVGPKFEEFISTRVSLS